MQRSRESAVESGEWLPTPPSRFAGVGWRALALLLDIPVLLLSWGLVIAGPLAELNDQIQLALVLAGLTLYFPMAWGRYGTTVGMRLLGLRIVRGRDGSKIDYRVAVIRFAVFLPSVVSTLVLVGLLFLLPVMLDARRRAIHDRVAGTVVLRLPYRGSRSWLW